MEIPRPQIGLKVNRAQETNKNMVCIRLQKLYKRIQDGHFAVTTNIYFFKLSSSAY